MAASANVRLRCSSWSQLASIYRRDLARGQLFLKTARPLAVGTGVDVRLLLPSGAAVDFSGVVEAHTGPDHARGAGILVSLEPLPPDVRLRLETAIRTAEEHRERTGSKPAGGSGATDGAGATGDDEPDKGALSADDGAPVLNAERELTAALELELQTFRKLNPFQILGLGYNIDTRDVHAAFAELSKRFHPDRYVRYQSPEIAALAESLFVTARDAYRTLTTRSGRVAALDEIRARRRPITANVDPVSSASAYPEPAPRGIDPLREFPEALELLSERRFDDAIALFHRAVADPDRRVVAQIGVELTAALQALSSGDRLAAVERFATILERDPDNELAARELALLRQAQSSKQQSLLARLVSERPVK